MTNEIQGRTPRQSTPSGVDPWAADPARPMPQVQPSWSSAPLPPNPPPVPTSGVPSPPTAPGTRAQPGTPAQWNAAPPAPSSQGWAPPPGWVAPAPPIVVLHNAGGPGLFVRAVWFLFIGWWLSGLAIVVAYLACVTLIGLPLGFYIFNRLPMIITLLARNDRLVTEVQDGVTTCAERMSSSCPCGCGRCTSCSSDGGSARSTSVSPGSFASSSSHCPSGS
jgi:hypothetical protein